MGFFSSSHKKLSYDQVKDMIDAQSGLRHEEKAYLKGVFEDYRVHGLDKKDIKDVIHDLEKDADDSISRNDLHRLEEELLAALEDLSR